ncbi:MAG: hypothetical protein ACM3U2_12185 [Deltaproteobacteria bacterium]
MIFLRRQFLSGSFWRTASRWAASVMVLTACSCSTLQRPVARNGAEPFLDDETPAATSPNAVADLRRRAARPHVPPKDVVLAGYESESDGESRRTKHPAITQTAAEARLPDCDVCPDPGACPAGEEYPATCATRFPDEYLFDGGDHGSPLFFEQDRIGGMQPEDTAASYVDECQQRRIAPSNCVAIYSPRFAAVTSISQPIEDVGGGRPTQAVVSRSGVGLVNRVGTFAQHQRDATERLVTRVRGSGLKGEVTAQEFDRPQAIHGHVHTTTPVQDFGFLRTGVFKQADEPRLAESIQSAVVWTRDQNPVIAAKTEGAVELKGRFQQLEMVGRENRCDGKARLRIVKLADRSAAQSGDVVTFTIRFDNIGDREVHDVVIVDNLTARLEYIDDSATCDLKGDLFLQDNGEGSLILRWELAEPLAAHSGGVVTFQARVR